LWEKEKAIIVKLKSKSVLKLTNKEYQILYQLNLGDEGSMQSILEALRNKKPTVKDGHVIMAIIEDKIVGWCLFWKSKWKRKYYTAYFFVSESYRRKGIGTKLSKHLKTLQKKKCLPPISLYPFDKIGDSFFKKNKAKKSGSSLYSLYFPAAA